MTTRNARSSLTSRLGPGSLRSSPAGPILSYVEKLSPVFRSVDDRPVVEFGAGVALVWRDAEAGWAPEDGAWASAPGLFGKEGSTLERDEFAARFPHADLSALPTASKDVPSQADA